MTESDLLPFQRRFIAAALRPGIRTVALSLPRGNGKSTLAAYLGLRCLTPGDTMYRAGTESHIAAASIRQARRTTWKLMREMGEDSRVDLKWSESSNEVRVRRPDCGTAVSVIASSGKTAQGMVRAPWILADEPGAWELIGGELMHDAIQTAQGKPGCDLRALYVGTLAPMAQRAGHWWWDMVHGGSTRTRVVMCLAGDPRKWDHPAEIRRVNPLMWSHPSSRAVLLEERFAARSSPAAKASFCSYRLNQPAPNEMEVPLTPDQWRTVLERAVQPAGRERPAVGIDLGQGRAWSTAVAIWPDTLRVEAIAIAPGIPSVVEQERRDLAPSGTYQALVETGRMRLAHGLRVPPVADLVRWVEEWNPDLLVCDRFRAAEIYDARPRARIICRQTLWSQSTADVRGLRGLALDGGLNVDPVSAPLLTASLAVSRLKRDEKGNLALVKGKQNTARDDVAQALLHAAGVVHRHVTRRAVAPSRVGAV